LSSEIDNLQRNYDLALQKIQLADDTLVKQVESLSQAEIHLRELELSLAYYKRQNMIFKWIILGTIVMVIGEGMVLVFMY
jgi:hypothetical protein